MNNCLYWFALAVFCLTTLWAVIWVFASQDWENYDHLHYEDES